MAKIVEEMKEGTGQKKLVTIYLDGREVKVPEG